MLRVLGFDALDRDMLSLREALRLAIEERRIWIKRSDDSPGAQYGVRYFLLESEEVPDQVREIDLQYHLKDHINPFSRCLKCNEPLGEIERSRIEDRVPERIFASFANFSICPKCERIYWPGSHLERMKKKLESLGWEIN